MFFRTKPLSLPNPAATEMPWLPRPTKPSPQTPRRPIPYYLKRQSLLQGANPTSRQQKDAYKSIWTLDPSGPMAPEAKTTMQLSMKQMSAKKK